MQPNNTRTYNERMVEKIESEVWAVSGWREGSRVWYLLTTLNKWDLRRVLDVVREGEFLTVSGRLFQVSAKAKLKERQ